MRKERELEVKRIPSSSDFYLPHPGGSWEGKYQALRKFSAKGRDGR